MVSNGGLHSAYSSLLSVFMTIIIVTESFSSMLYKVLFGIDMNNW